MLDYVGGVVTRRECHTMCNSCRATNQQMYIMKRVGGGGNKNTSFGIWPLWAERAPLRGRTNFLVNLAEMSAARLGFSSNENPIQLTIKGPWAASQPSSQPESYILVCEESRSKEIEKTVGWTMKEPNFFSGASKMVVVVGEAPSSCLLLCIFRCSCWRIFPPVAITPRDWAMGGENKNSAVHARLSVSSLGFHPLARFPFSLRQTRNV